MASHTIELSFLLRGFSQINDRPAIFASPHSIIENSREEFFKAVGNYNFKIWGDERDLSFKENFEKAFLEYFYMDEIGYQTPDAFLLQLGSFLRRKMPIYCQHWRKVLDEMYITQTGNVTGNVIGNAVGNSKTNDTRSTDSWSKSTTNANSEGTGETTSVTRAGVSDTPQNELDINLDDIAYASQVNKQDNLSTSKSTGKNDSVTNTEDHTVSVGASVSNNVNDTKTDSVTNNHGRNKDIFDIYDEWIKSGYDLYTPLFKDAINEQLFCLFL